MGKKNGKGGGGGALLPPRSLITTLTQMTGMGVSSITVTFWVFPVLQVLSLLSVSQSNSACPLDPKPTRAGQNKNKNKTNKLEIMTVVCSPFTSAPDEEKTKNSLTLTKT